MWVFTTDGFFSAVQLKGQPDKVLVRARARDDLVRLGQKIGFDETAITTMKLADYEFRAGLNGEVSKDAYAGYLVDAVVNGLNYESHCKEEMTKPEGLREPKRYRWYLDCWNAGLDFQDGPSRTSKFGTPGRLSSYSSYSYDDVLSDSDYVWTESDDEVDTSYDPLDEWMRREDAADALELDEDAPSIYDPSDLSDPRFLDWCIDNGFIANDMAMDSYIAEQINP